MIDPSKELKRILKKLIWKWWLISDDQRPFNPLFKRIIHGKPIDRYYIEQFLEQNKKYIKNVCLEITDNAYTKQFGGENVSRSDILDNDSQNRNATIHDDLRTLSSIENSTYDCIILTQTFQYVDDVDSALRNLHRILKPDGVLLVTLPAVARMGKWTDYHRFTKAGAEYLFQKSFKNIMVSAQGNLRISFKSMVSAFQEFTTTKELEYTDPMFPTIITVVAIK
jgi:SAM-dependent methyltransferase